MKNQLRDEINDAVKTIRQHTDSRPSVGIILGSGLGALVDDIHTVTKIPYTSIPHFPESTVEFHDGELILGTLIDHEIVAMHGRFHVYEGYSLQQVSFPVRVMKAIGVNTLIVSNACGGINKQFKPGDIMIIQDHINLMGGSPLIGMNDDSLGPRFPDMSEPYSQRLNRLAERVANTHGITVHKGVYAAVTGPNLETAAEYRFLRTIGADVVGMSTVPETIVAVHSGIEVLGLSVITDACVPETLKPINVAEIIRIANRAEPALTTIIKGVLTELNCPEKDGAEDGNN